MEEENEVRKVKVSIDSDLVERMMKMKKVGDSYSDVIRKLLENKKE